MSTLSARLNANTVAFPVPHGRLRACVVIPVRNEQAVLSGVIAALAAQRDLKGEALDAHDFEVLLLLNNCTDATAAVAESLQQRFPQLALHVAQVNFDPHEAHVGRARQSLFDVAFQRFERLNRPAGLILSTDADSRPAPDWIAQNALEVAAGVDGVGGWISLDRVERLELPAGVRRLFSLDVMYRRALEELRSLYAPQLHDPFPRHHQHFGASIAVTAAAYGRAGGMPLRASSEDVALYQAVLDSGGRFRHSFRVRVVTSARMVGRAQRGLADAIQAWNGLVGAASPVFVEPAHAAEERLARLGLWCFHHPGVNPPPALTVTPEVTMAGRGQEIGAAIRGLRTRSSALLRLPFRARLAAVRLWMKAPADRGRVLA
ncbi:MAG: glycosyltransferase family 2 protein [Aphanothece saxicola GSE-SYN-MK-01-06B]|jgi:hypothetical protein|nr:glycosyltransferase family 2 protein [Aphanothece saxicola GSE-SYN-MK-01-06B]